MNSKLEQRVMGNIAVIYAARKLVSITALKLYALVFSLGGIVAFVSVSNVMSNFVNVAHGGVGSIALFTVSAVLGTTLLVQVALALCAAATISLVVPVFRGRSVLA
ncbi:MAG: hypothetical protein Q8P58_01020 [Candidatus Adlerbacteria bacterium]|nr:hypothetical protein [Candidatus Adlerbacteria bacterium]